MEVALLGSGLFASRCHAPALKASACHVRGVWSRGEAGARSLASSFGETCRALWGDQGLRDLLADAQLQAVFVCLPLDVQPLYIQKALEAGKHVFSEKPVAADGKAAKELIHLYRTDFAPQRLRWAVGENYRYEAGLLRAAEVARSLDLVTLEMNVHSPMPPENDFFKTSWRQKPSWQGGFFQDGAVHFAAALRMLAGSRPLRVWATCVTKSKHLPPPDTLAGVVDFGEVMASVSISFATSTRKFALCATGVKGKVEVERAVSDGKDGYSVCQTLVEEGKRMKTETVHYPFNGVPAEFEAFLKSQCEETSSSPSSPEEALLDLELIEALLASGKTDGQPVPVGSR